MKALAITHQGIEDIAALEIKEIIKAKNIATAPTIITFETEKLENLALLCYKSQSLRGVFILLDSFKFNKDFETKLEKSIAKIKIPEFIKPKTFCFRANHIENDQLTKQEIETTAGDFFNQDLKVNLEDPDIQFYIHIFKNTCYIGIDLAGKDLSKRDYRIFTIRKTLKSNISYALIRLANYKENKSLLDPYTGSGEIPIEAALFANNIPHNLHSQEFLFTKFIDFNFDKIKQKDNKLNITAYDPHLHNTKSTKKNAKIAGVDKFITISKIDIEWLDTKIDKQSLDCITTHLPNKTSQNNINDLKKQYNEFFYQSDYITKKGSILVLVCNDLSLIKETLTKYPQFKTQEERTIMQGKQPLQILILEKN